MVEGSAERRAGRSKRLLVLGAVALAVAVVVVRVIVGGTDALERGRAALAAGDELLAGLELREAVAWYLPGAWWRDEAADLLWNLYEDEADRGDTQAAVRSLNLLRSGLFAARSVIEPDEARRARVDEALSALLARWEAEEAAVDGRRGAGDRAERQEHFAARLSLDPRPSRPWGIAAIVGFILWVGGVAGALRRRGRARWLLLAAALGGLLLFLGGLALA